MNLALYIRNKYCLAALITVAAVVVAVYFPALSHRFLHLWDDQWMVVNFYTSGGFTWENIRAVFTETYYGQYSPLNQMSYIILYNIFGYNPFWFHLASLVWHIGNGVLVFILIRNLADYSGHVKKENTVPVAALTAALFAIHPTAVETVAWISASKILIAEFYFFLSLICYLEFVRKNRILYYLLSILSFCLAFLAKEQVITLSLCVVLIDWFMKRNMKNPDIWIEKIPFVALSVIFGLIGAFVSGGVNTPGYPFLQRIVLGCYCVFEYIIKSLLPYNLSYIYPFPMQPGDPVPARFWIYPAIILFLLCLIWINRKNRILIFSALFFIINLSLFIHVVPLPRIAMVADRYNYVAFIGVSFFLSCYFVEFYRKMKINRKKVTISTILILYCIYLGTYSNIYCRQWHDTDSLKRHIRELLKQRENDSGEKTKKYLDM